ncbi:MAG: hypothetical protein FJ098_16830, partial [Deltaproteobacteria bacterium]|nr:hypothetical protein [Deltaproteobacteria bacterium]
MRTYVMLGVLVGLAAGEARADVPGLLHYQGYLTDVEGTPVSGVWTVTFGLYTQQSGGTAFFAESQVVEPDVGVFSVLLGTQPGNSIDPGAFAGGAVWLQLTVNDGETPPVSLMPRQRVAAHPYAMWTDSAGTCDEAADAAALGGVPAASYALKTALTGLVDEDDLPALLALLGFTPGGSYGDDDVQAYLDLIGITPGGGGYGDPDVADYLAMNGFEPGPYFDGTWASLSGKPDFVTHAELADFVVTEDILDEVAESGLFLMADGSVVASGDLDLGGNELLDVVIENASAASPPTGPKQGQLWFDTTAKALKVYNGTQWIALGSGGGSVNDLQCNGCVDASDVSFGYAGAPAQGGAAFSAMGLVCDGCVDETTLGVDWALGTAPGGAAADLDCVGC